MSISNPNPTTLWQLRSELLAGGLEPESPTAAVLNAFYSYLTAVEANLSAQGYTQFASLLNIGAAGAAAFLGLMQENLSFLSLVQDGLNVLASRQYIKGSTADLKRTVLDGGWFVYRALWQLSCRTQAELTPSVRREQLDNLFSPLHEETLDLTTKAVLVGRLYQIVLIMSLNADQAAIELEAAS